MATFRKRGSYQWQAQVRKKGQPLQTKTFETRALAATWARAVEVEMDKGVFVSRAEAESTTLKELLERYLEEITPLKKARHIESRQQFYDWLADTIQIEGISNVERDHAFDDEKFRSGGIRLQQVMGEPPQNFMRHYYDISQLLQHPEVTDFIGTPEYQKRKKVRFRTGDNLNISENEAFLLSDPATHDQYALAYQATASLYLNDQIPFDTILDRIQAHIEAL